MNCDLFTCPFYAVFLLIGIINMWLILFTYTYTISIVISVGVVQFKVLTIKLRQIHKQLVNFIHNQNSSQAHQKYCLNLTTVLKYFTEYNCLYGRIFLAFLISNLPTNSYLFLTLILNDIPMVAQIYLTVYTFLQVICTFGLHFIFVRFSKHFHSSGKILQSQMASNRRNIGNLASRIRLANSIAFITTKRQIGMTYGPFGRITFKTFFQFFVFYSKCMIITYKIIQLK